ncbi:hypothetical protein KP806_18265 [Paenibacillus sp. N4]|uniref:EH signature domain-containing protein n=1 Tax=Paenibacillus vietnamensis TaxID=2590547 RepID=UPI001CD0E3E8|nr:EH signature domain-containing protein [Paenibacillus vietnamensis]MCA0757009.1 hypothetical protein [Paenibacillus vietnamensis]
MDNNTYIFNFTFTPKKLSEARKQVQKRYEDIDLLTASQISGMRLPKLLELIRRTPEAEIEALALQLKKTDIMVLLYQFPHNTESNDTQKKINLLISHRYNSMIGNYVWGIFQHDYQNIFVHDLLRRFFAVERFDFLSINNDAMIKRLTDALTNKSGVAHGLVHLFMDGNMKTEQLLKTIKIKSESPIEDFIMYQMLRECLKKDDVIRRDGESFICQLLDRYPMHQYQNIIKIYLEARDHEHFHPKILEQAIIRLHDPRERMADWAFLSESAFNEVNRWLLEIELKKFFEGDTNRRFEYWKKYFHYISNVVQLKGRNDPKVAFIYFNEFVVVEFGDMGASYFYHKRGFDRFILSQTTGTEFAGKSTRVKESLLKITDKIRNGESLFINRLRHIGPYETWTAKFTHHMQEYLDGYYDYSE